MGSHLIDGEFQSDKYPTTPRGKVPLSCKDPMAQDLLWEYARRRREVDDEFSGDLERALKVAGYEPRQAEDDATFCLACAKPLMAGDKFYRDIDGGFLHAACCGPERESYVDGDGEPLKDGEPIPEPSIWPEGLTPEQLAEARTLAKRLRELLGRTSPVHEHIDDIVSGADAIDRSAAEIERLREALHKFRLIAKPHASARTIEGHRIGLGAYSALEEIYNAASAVLPEEPKT